MPPKKQKKQDKVEEEAEEKPVPYVFNIKQAGKPVSGTFNEEILSSEKSLTRAPITKR